MYCDSDACEKQYTNLAWITKLSDYNGYDKKLLYYTTHISVRIYTEVAEDV